MKVFRVFSHYNSDFQPAWEWGERHIIIRLEDLSTDISVFSLLLSLIAHPTLTFEDYTIFWECFLIGLCFPCQKKPEVLILSYKSSYDNLIVINLEYALALFGDFNIKKLVFCVIFYF